MAVKTKAQLATDIAASTFSAPQQVILDDIVDSYEDIFANVTTVQRNALTPTNGLIVYNTDNSRYEYWDGVSWMAIGQNLSTPLVVKIDLSSSDILALNGTPIAVAPAPGTGYALAPISIAWRFTFGSTQYTDGGGSNGAGLKSTSKAWANRFGAVDSASIKAAANSSGIIPISNGSAIDALVENDGLELIANSAFSAGDGTLTVWVTYSIIVW